jgi:hypothetical protein
MSRMKRRQIYLEADQDRRLRILSRRNRMSESALIRQGIDRVLSGAISLPLDHEAWQKELKFMKDWARKGPVKGRRTWTREDAHER